MKYIYSGKYIQVAGRMFAFGKPVEVNDKATQRILDGRPDFRRLEDAVREETQGTGQGKAVLGCPKCGKQIKRGLVMHMKWCKG